MHVLKPIFLFLLGCLFCPLAFAQLDAYDYKQELTGISEQWHKIDLPDAVFAKIASDLADIRIYGVLENDTLEAPYILQTLSGKDDQKDIYFNLINTASNAKGNYFTYEIPTSEDINEIKLVFKNQNFDWHVQLEGSQNQNEWFTILDDYRILSLKTEQTEYSFTDLKFPRSKYRFFRLLVKTDERPELVSAKLSLDERTHPVYKEYPITFMNISQENKNTIIDIDLKQRLPLSYLQLNVGDEIDYYRPISIQYVSDSVKTEKGWKYRYGNIHSGTLTSFEKTGCKFATALAQKLRVIINNHDNAPLEIESASAKGYAHQLIARFTEPAKYYLAYGNASAQKPYYDIVQAATAIPENLTVLTLGDIEDIPKKKTTQISPLFENKLWLWAIMALVIAVLGWFTIRMMRKL